MFKKIFGVILILTADMAYLPLTALAVVNPVSVSGWEGSFFSTPADASDITPGLTGIRIITDPAVVQSGRGALMVFCEKNLGNLYSVAQQSVSGFEMGKKYRLTGKFNTPADNWRFKLRMGDVDFISPLGTVTGGVINQWAQVDYTFTFNFASKIFRIWAEGAGSIYADGLSIKEVLYDAGGAEVIGYGPELLINGDFEDNLDLTPPGDVRNVQVKNMDETAEITWTNPSDSDFARADVYNVTGGGKVFAASVNDGKLVLTGLENGAEYQFLIQSVDGWDNHSEGVTVSVSPVPSPFKYNEPVFYIDGVPASALSAGNLRASFSCKNNGMPEDYSVELILALLKDGALTDLASEYRVIPVSAWSERYTELSAEITVPAGEGYSVELFIWDSVTGMESLADYVTLQ
jgi:hypothetical protein